MKEYHYVGFLLISKYLNVYDLKNLSKTSKKLASLYDDIYELHVPLSTTMITNNSYMLHLAQLFPKVAVLTLYNNLYLMQPYSILKLIHHLNYFHNISILSLSNIHISKPPLDNVNCISEEGICNDIDISNEWIDNANKSIQSMIIKNVKGINLFLNTLIKNKKYQFIKKLEIEYCNELSIATVNTLLDLLPYLNQLHLISCINIIGKIEYVKLQNISSLKLIKCIQSDLTLCADINNNIYHKLQYCDLSYSNITNIELELLLKTSLIIKSLILKNCLNIKKSLILISRSLEVIDLQNSINIISLAIVCPLLKSINLHICKNLLGLTIKSTILKILDLKMLINLSYLLIDCPLLNVLNLNGCSSIISIINTIPSPLIETSIIDDNEISSIGYDENIKLKFISYCKQFEIFSNHKLYDITSEIKYNQGYPRPRLYDIYKNFPNLNFYYFINNYINGTYWSDEKAMIIKELNLNIQDEDMVMREMNNYPNKSNHNNNNNQTSDSNYLNKKNINKQKVRRRRSSV